MSRVGKQPIQLPQGTSVQLGAKEVLVKGPKGVQASPVLPGISVNQQNDSLVVTRADDSKQSMAFHGLNRSLINNAVIGVTIGFKKELEINGVGFKAAVKGKQVELQLGYSHPVFYKIPDGISIEVEKNTRVTIEGVDKQKVGQVAAEIRKLRPPEVYKGKGIRYKGEYVQRKVGKAATGK